jgi:hypothetical protein
MGPHVIEGRQREETMNGLLAFRFSFFLELVETKLVAIGT